MIQNIAPWLSSFLKCNDARVSLTEKMLAGICPAMLPITLPPVGRQDRTWRQKSIWGRRRIIPLQRMRIDYPLQTQKWKAAMNHRRHRAVLCDACFSPEAFDAFNSGEAYLRAAQDGLARATEQYVKDIRVRKFDDYIYQ